jgi:hypothetical protein
MTLINDADHFESNARVIKLYKKIVAHYKTLPQHVPGQTVHTTGTKPTSLHILNVNTTLVSSTKTTAIQYL